MKAQVLSFVSALRGAGLSVTVAETLDALQAVGVVGIWRPAFREGLAATLVKDQADRPLFDTIFDRFFAVPARQRGKGERRRAGADSGSGARGRPGTILPRPAPKTEPRQREPTQRAPAAERRDQSQRPRRDVGPRQLARNKALQRVPFKDMSGRDVEECDALVKELAQRFRAHLSRRLHRMRRGRLDMRRTVRQSISTGGVPLVPAFRQRRPGRLDLLVLCDCSHSVATASRFLLSLLAPAYD
ncbi:MAG: VWA domain-containing protein, partial [Candidatus Binatia bacterium]